MTECFVVIDLLTTQIYGSNAYFDRGEAEDVMVILQERYPKANWVTMQLNLRPKKELQEISKQDIGSIEDVFEG